MSLKEGLTAEQAWEWLDSPCPHEPGGDSHGECGLCLIEFRAAAERAGKRAAFLEAAKVVCVGCADGIELRDEPHRPGEKFHYMWGQCFANALRKRAEEER